MHILLTLLALKIEWLDYVILQLDFVFSSYKVWKLARISIF